MSTVILYKTIGEDVDGVVRACSWAADEAGARDDRRVMADDLTLVTLDTAREVVPVTPEALANWLSERNVGE